MRCLAGVPSNNLIHPGLSKVLLTNTPPPPPAFPIACIALRSHRACGWGLIVLGVFGRSIYMLVGASLYPFAANNHCQLPVPVSKLCVALRDLSRARLVYLGQLPCGAFVYGCQKPELLVL